LTSSQNAKKRVRLQFYHKLPIYGNRTQQFCTHSGILRGKQKNWKGQEEDLNSAPKSSPKAVL